MNRNFKFSPGEFYHAFTRGVDKRILFYDKSDYERFLSLLYLANGEKPIDLSEIENESRYSFDRGNRLVDICSFCIMTNHVHLLLHEIQDGGISKFMKKLLTGYAMFFNKKYRRTGALFQGKFQAKHLDNDNYLKHVPVYIHLNSLDKVESHWKEYGVKDIKKSEKYVKSYPYSSFLDYAGEKTRKESVILNKETLPQYYENVAEVLADLQEWIRITPELFTA